MPTVKSLSANAWSGKANKTNELFAMDPDNVNQRRLARNNEGVFTHIVTWTGTRRSLSSLVQRPEGYSLPELSNFLARQGLVVPNPAQLENAVFMVLDIAEPRQG